MTAIHLNLNSKSPDLECFWISNIRQISNPHYVGAFILYQIDIYIKPSTTIYSDHF